MGRYADWQQVKEHVQDFEAQPDTARMNTAIGWAEDYFDGRLRERYTVPFTSGDNPNAWALARRIVALWAAAKYLINRRQEEADEDTVMWYPRQLVADGDALFEQFISGTPPSDAEVASDEFSELVHDGYSDRTDQQKSDLTAIFMRGHLISGDSRHW